MLRIMLWVVSLTLLLGVVAVVLIDWALRTRYEPDLAEHQRKVTANVGFFCEQQAKLGEDPWFHEPRTEGDAGPLLNAWLPWEPKREMPKGSPLTIPASLPRNNLDFKDWLTSKVDVSRLDFGWMARLQAYDRWDILRNTPAPLPDRIDWTNAPIPDYVKLQLWAKFRLLHGLRTGQPVEAAKDVRHLAWLAYRSDMLLGGAIAAVLLRHEREAYDSLASPPPEWHPMSREQVARMRAVIMTSHAFSNLASPAEVAKQARGCGQPAVSGCIGLAEASIMAKYVQPLAESMYRPAYAAIAEDLAAMPCATSFARTIWERGMGYHAQRLGSVLSGQPEWLDLLPGAITRRHYAGLLITIGVPGLGPLEDFRGELESGKFQTPAP